MNLKKPKGTQDILPAESEKWQYVEEKARQIFSNYQYKEIRTPMFEHYEVISRSVGDTTDIVSKEMYDFYDKGNRHITLRPEGTAPVVRSFVENKLFAPEHPKPYKLFYMGEMFRYERQQKGRYRQFRQIGAECFGSESPATDVETIAMLVQFFEELGIQKTQLHMNTLGNQESRIAYRQALVDYLEPQIECLSEDSKRRLYENPLRVLDSKEEKDKRVVANAPSILDYLDKESKQHFEEVKLLLESLGISYVIDPTLVRGLDYYNHTIFELMSDAIGGKQVTIAAGGRYDSLVEYFGGPKTAGFGFAIGLERLLLVLESLGIELSYEKELEVYVVGIGEETSVTTLKMVQALRKQGFSAERDFLNRKAKAQFKSVDKLNARFVMAIGETEIEKQEAIVKNARTGKALAFSFDEIQHCFETIYMELVEK